MVDLKQKLKNKKMLVFFDLEGTQFSHEMIQIGAVAVTLGANGKIKKYHQPFNRFVRARNKIGSFVTNLTGITEEKLKKEAIQFSQAMKEFKEYCGRYFKSTLFISFGNFDLAIIEASVSYNLDAPKEICHQIQTNYMDYLDFITEFIRDEKGNPYSLVNYCKLLDIKESGKAHDAVNDAINLAHLYEKFFKQKGIIYDEYKRNLKRVSHMPKPLQSAINDLLNGKDVSAEDFNKKIRDYIDDKLS